MQVYHGEERNGPGCMVVDGYEIHEEGSARHSGRKERSTHHYLLNPLFTCSMHDAVTMKIKESIAS